MSKERDLLRRALEIFEPNGKERRLESVVKLELAHEIRAFLAAEPETDEPVGKHFAPCGFRHRKTHEFQTCLQGDECNDPHWEDIYFLCDCGELDEGCIPIHPPRPEPARKPMKDREIMDLAKSLGFDDITTMDFAIGFRYAEKHHGITK